MRTSRLTRTCRGERGAVLVIFAAFTIVAVVMLAAVVDLGDQRQERKELTLSTDAAALAAAGLADTEDPQLTTETPGTLVDCGSVGISPEAENPEAFLDVQEAVEEYLKRNGDSQPVDCKVVRSNFKEGYVVVSANEIVDYAFGPALGLENGGVSGASVAAIEVDTGGGLRPIGICGAMVSLKGVTGYPELALGDVADGSDLNYGRGTDGYIFDKNTASETTFTARFPIEKVKGGSCGDDGGAGNFGQLDFGGDPSTDCDNNGHFCNDLREGYYDEVSNPTKGETGANWGNTATTDSMDELLVLGRFWAPIVSDYSGSGNGAEAHVEFFAQVEMRGYCTTSKSAGTASPCQYSETGSPSDKTTYFDLEISRIVDYVPAGPPLTDDADYHPPRLCAVQNESAQIAAGCPTMAVTSSTTSAPPATVTTTTTTTTPLTCQVQDHPDSASQKLKKNQNDLNSGVTFSLQVNDLAACSGPAWVLVRQSDGTERTFDSGSSNSGQRTYSATVQTGPFAAGEVWDVVISRDGLVISDQASLTITGG